MIMGYNASMLDKRISILNRQTSEAGEFGRGSAGITYENVGSVWASVEFSKGIKALREGAIEAYDIIMVRTRYTSLLTRESRILYEGRTYFIESFHADKRANIIQITASEMVGEGVTEVNPCC